MQDTCHGCKHRHEVGVGWRHAPRRHREQRRLAPGVLPTRGGVAGLEDHRPQDAARLLPAAGRLEHICAATNHHSLRDESVRESALLAT